MGTLHLFQTIKYVDLNFVRRFIMGDIINGGNNSKRRGDWNINITLFLCTVSKNIYTVNL